MTPTKVSTFSSQAYLDRLNQSTTVNTPAPATFNDFPVRSLELKSLLTELSKKIHGIKFTPATRDYSGRGGYKAFYAYFEGDYFAVGQVGYADTSVHNNKGNSFFVASRKIANNKYNTNRDQFHIKAAKDLNTAVRNAKKYLVRYTDSEMASTMYDDVASKIKVPIRALHNDLHDLLGTIGFSAWLGDEDRIRALCEFKRMRETGYVPETLQYKKVFDSVDSLYNRYIELRNVKIRVRYVRVDTSFQDNPKLVVLTPKPDVIHAFFHPDNVETVSYDAKDAPEDITNRIAVLQILNNEQYVDEVGCKVDNTHYFIQENYV